MSPLDTPLFEDHCSCALEDLRACLTELYQALGADPDSPQEISREYGVNRNLSWKVSRLMRAQAPLGVFQHLPGMAGLQILLKAFGSAGAPLQKIEAVRCAIAEFERMVAVHAGDRQTLELMLDSLAPEGSSGEPLEVSRKLAFRGNSGIWGVQAKLRLRTVLLAPNPEDPLMLDIAQVSGLLGLRRFRHGAVWTLFQRENFNDDGSARHALETPLDPSTAAAGSLLMPEFCSRPLPEIRSTATPLGVRYEQVGGQLGNRGVMTCVYGSYRRNFAPRYRDEKNVRGELFAVINAPAEHLLFDVIVHRDLVAEGFDLSAEVLHADDSRSFFDRRGAVLPCPERVRWLGTRAPRLATPLAPRYEELVGRVYQRLDWEPQAFRGARFELTYPPLPYSVVQSYVLPSKP